MFTPLVRGQFISERVFRFGVALAVTAVPLGVVITGAAPAIAETASAVAPVLNNGPDSVGGGVGPSSLVLDSTGTTAYALNYLSNEVNKVLTSSPFTVTSISLPGGSGPSDIAMSTDGTFLVVSNMDNSTYSRILLSDRSVTTFSLPVGSAPRAVAVSGAYAYFAETGTSKVDKVDLATNTVVSSLTLPGAPNDIAVAPNGTFAYAASWPGNSLYKIATSGLALDGNSVGAQQPVNIGVSPDSATVYATLNAPSGFVTYDVASAVATTRNIAQVNRPISLAIDNQGKFAYIGRYGGALTKLDLTTFAATLFSLVSPLNGNEPSAMAFVTSGADANKYAFALNPVSSQLFRISLSPSAPTPISGVRGNAQVALTWTTPTYPGASAIADYVIEYATSTAGPWTSFTHAPSTSTTATVTGLTNGTAYYFRTAGVSADGTGLYATSGALTPATVPGPPTNVTGVPGDGRITISWVAPAADGGSPVTDYLAEVSVDGTSWTPVTHTSSTATSIVATGLTNGTSYLLRVAAINAVGTGAFGTGGPSAPVAGSTPAGPSNPGSPKLPVALTVATSVEGPQGNPPASLPNIGKARVIYRMLPSGTWMIVPRFRTAAKSIPANALFTVVRSPITGQSKNIPVAKLKNSALATKHNGTAYAGVLKGKLWRGTARIIVNW